MFGQKDKNREDKNKRNFIELKYIVEVVGLMQFVSNIISLFKIKYTNKIAFGNFFLSQNKYCI